MQRSGIQEHTINKAVATSAGLKTKRGQVVRTVEQISRQQLGSNTHIVGLGGEGCRVWMRNDLAETTLAAA